MKLHWAPTSPYVRKVMVAAHELGVADRFELVETTPQSVIDDVSGDNPLGMIPALVTDDGEALYDSAVIIAWLDDRFGGGLIPEPGPGAWAVHRRHALAHGLIDTTNAWAHEQRRPPELQWPDQDAKLRRRIGLALDGLEREAASLAGPFTIAPLAAGVALGYVDRHFPDDDWRPARPALAEWYAGVARRPSMVATAPPPLRSAPR
jgi:glutathione S-transferase